MDKDLFLKALFKEIREEKFYKILLLQSIAFFDDLSPYSMYVLASNVEVREAKYGELIVKQGEVPDNFCILAYGSCKLLY
jgi:hypothetical protein